jgi:hypothetical protein
MVVALLGICIVVPVVVNIVFSQEPSTTYFDPTAGSILLLSTTTAAADDDDGDDDDKDVSAKKSSTMIVDLSPPTPTAEKSFLEIGLRTGTDKVEAVKQLDRCLKDDNVCVRPSCVREECRPWGHYYHTMYQSRFGKYTLPSTDRFQFLEIGYVS